MWMLGTDFQSSGRAASVPNHCHSTPSPDIFVKIVHRKELAHDEMDSFLHFLFSCPSPAVQWTIRITIRCLFEASKCSRCYYVYCVFEKECHMAFCVPLYPVAL